MTVTNQAPSETIGDYGATYQNEIVLSGVFQLQMSDGSLQAGQTLGTYSSLFKGGESASLTLFFSGLPSGAAPVKITYADGVEVTLSSA